MSPRIHPDSSDDPRDLARLVLAIVGTEFDESVTLVVGRVPDGWPASLVPPPPVVALGGMATAGPLNAVFLYPPTVERPVAEYRVILENDGWRLPDSPFRQAFEHTGRAMFCRDSSMINVRRALSDERGKSILVSLSHSDGWPCRPDARMPHRPAIAVPRLAAPPAVRWDKGGGGGGGGDNINHHIRVTTDLSPAELLPLYARQLADAGWKTTDMQTTAANAVQWLEATDEQGRIWRGLLAVYLNGSSREVFIYMASDTPNHPARRLAVGLPGA